jgi:branched-chain amino acid transport system substrate-binding protein
MRCSMGLSRTLPAHLLAIGIVALAAAAGATAGDKRFGPGVSDDEITIGQTMPYSGPSSAWGAEGLAELAYIKMINEQGGVNGRQIRLISLDDAYSPPKTVEQTRKLVEQDQVALIFSSLGTAPNTAIQKYLNERKVPQLFIATGASKWSDPEHFPWTMGWQASYLTEARIYAHYIREQRPDGKIAVLYQNDDYGKDYLKGLKDGLGAKAASMIVAAESYETTEPTIDSHIVNLKASGADVFINITTPKFAAQAIRKNAEIEWKPLHFLNSVSSSIGATIKPAGFDAAQDIISSAYLKDPTDPQWKDDAGMKTFNAFLDKYYPEANRNDAFVLYGYTVAQSMVYVLKACGDNLTRENVMKQAASVRGLELGGLLPGIKINTSATDFAPIEQLRLQKLEGETWHLFGDIISAEVAG